MKGKLYLFGGVSRPDATECLPGVYSFDIGEDVTVGGGKRNTSSLVCAEAFFCRCCFSVTLRKSKIKPNSTVMVFPFSNSVSDLGLFGSRGRGPQSC